MLLIDGYNLLHAMAPGKPGEGARERLIGLLQGYCERGGYRARIVFDATAGMRRRESRGPVEIRTVAQGRTADEEILAAIAATADRTEYALVSNDRALTSAAAKKGIEAIPCEDFARRLVPPAEAGEKRDGASSAEVDYWMREFGLEEEPPAGG